MASASEFAFQNDMIQQLVANGWLLGKPENYSRERVLYSELGMMFFKQRGLNA